MINSKADLREYLEQDKIQLGIHNNCFVGANAVVVKSFHEDSITLWGASKYNSDKFIYWYK